MIYDIITWYIYSIDITLMIYHPNIIYMKHLADIVDHQSDRQGLLEFTAKLGAKELDDQQLEPLFQWMGLDIADPKVIGETMFKHHLNIIFPIWNLLKCQFYHHFPIIFPIFQIYESAMPLVAFSTPFFRAKTGLAAARQVSVGLVVGGQYSGGSKKGPFFRPKKIPKIPRDPYLNGLLWGKIYRKTAYLMGKSMVSCRFSRENQSRKNIFIVGRWEINQLNTEKWRCPLK